MADLSFNTHDKVVPKPEPKKEDVKVVAPTLNITAKEE
jgi:hypothetical protein